MNTGQHGFIQCDESKMAHQLRTIGQMSTRLDQQIEQLEEIVETRLNLCKVTWQGARCTLPANHDKDEPHRFDVHAR